MNINKLNNSIVNEAFKAFSVLATYQFVSGVKKRCRVIVDHSMTGFPSDGESQVQDSHVEIIMKVNDVERPSKGDQITVRDNEYTVSKIVSDDSILVRVLVR